MHHRQGVNYKPCHDRSSSHNEIYYDMHQEIEVTVPDVTKYFHKKSSLELFLLRAEFPGIYFPAWSELKKHHQVSYVTLSWQL